MTSFVQTTAMLQKFKINKIIIIMSTVMDFAFLQKSLTFQISMVHVYFYSLFKTLISQW